MSQAPRGPTLPRHLSDWCRVKDYDSILGYLQWAKDNIWQNMMTEQKLRSEHQTFLLYGFLAETGLTPSKCMLVEKRTEKGEMFWGYIKADPEGEKRATELHLAHEEIQRVKTLLAECSKTIRELREEITHLKGRR